MSNRFQSDMTKYKFSIEKTVQLKMHYCSTCNCDATSSKQWPCLHRHKSILEKKRKKRKKHHLTLRIDYYIYWLTSRRRLMNSSRPHWSSAASDHTDAGNHRRSKQAPRKSLCITFVQLILPTTLCVTKDMFVKNSSHSTIKCRTKKKYIYF